MTIPKGSSVKVTIKPGTHLAYTVGQSGAILGEVVDKFGSQGQYPVVRLVNHLVIVLEPGQVEIV